MSLSIVHFNHILNEGLVGWPDIRTATHGVNYGDMLVCAAVLRQVEAEVTTATQFGGNISPTSTKFLIRGSTYLHRMMDFEKVNATLDSAPCDGAIVGLGAQNPTLDVSFLDENEGAKGFIARLNERSKSISVRGDFTAQVVERLGGKNIRVTGCPSLFYRLVVPTVSLPETLLGEERSVGISVHTKLGGIFCRAPKAALKAHSTVIYEALRRSRVVQIYEQGVLSEYNIADRDAAYRQRLDAAKELAERIGYVGSVDRFLTLFVSINTINEWISKVRDLDAMIGFRFHGNMIALMQGRPCSYVTYDSRLEEFCRLYQLPYQDVESDLKPIDSMIEHDWTKTNEAIAKCGSEMKNFWTENGFTHRIS